MRQGFLESCVCTRYTDSALLAVPGFIALARSLAAKLVTVRFAIITLLNSVRYYQIYVWINIAIPKKIR